MADISKITLPNGDTYNIKDANAKHSVSTGDSVAVTAGTAATLSYTARTVKSVKSVGSTPTLGTAIPADDITAWTTNTPTTITYTARSIPNVTSVGSRTVTNLSLTATTVDNGVSSTDYQLTIPNAIVTAVTVPTLGTEIAADDITAYTAGTAASLSYTAKSIPNVTGVGSVPTTEDITCDDITAWTTNTPTAVTKKTVVTSVS